MRFYLRYGVYEGSDGAGACEEVAGTGVGQEAEDDGEGDGEKVVVGLGTKLLHLWWGCVTCGVWRVKCDV